MSWKKEVKEISLRKKLALQQGGKEAIEIQHAKGRLTLRERIDLLLDKNTKRFETITFNHDSFKHYYYFSRYRILEELVLYKSE